MTPVEVTTRYATVVDGLPAAWQFVMAHVDKCGPAPTIDIKPVQWHDAGDYVTKFETCVSGMIEET